MKKNKTKKNILLVFGTRPEAIKMAPLFLALKKNSNFDVRICVTAQHREMLDQVLEIFSINPEFDLNIMSKGQSISQITANVLEQLPKVFDNFMPDLLLVHGDTTTTFSASLSSFNANIKVGHVEAGLRTGNIFQPWPEEANRRLTSVLTQLHFAPSKLSKENLIKEGIDEETIFVTGNTVIDALFIALQKIKDNKDFVRGVNDEYPFLTEHKKIILVTGHRRESFGKGFENICKALLKISDEFEDLNIVYPVHLNPKVREPVNKHLKDKQNIHLIEPLDYLRFIYFMEKSSIILTDSGGVQEEAPSLNKPVIVMRNTTERPEALETGIVKLGGTNPEKIFSLLKQALQDIPVDEIKNPYGNGDSSIKIVKIIEDFLDN